ncbi:hypothetical protein GGI43DRAFT_401461 [Trichoderma evansii]
MRCSDEILGSGGFWIKSIYIGALFLTPGCGQPLEVLPRILHSRINAFEPAFVQLFTSAIMKTASFIVAALAGLALAAPTNKQVKETAALRYANSRPLDAAAIHGSASKRDTSTTATREKNLVDLKYANKRPIPEGHAPKSAATKRDTSTTATREKDLVDLKYANKRPIPEGHAPKSAATKRDTSTTATREKDLVDLKYANKRPIPEGHAPKASA